MPDRSPKPSPLLILTYTVGGGALGVFAFAICTDAGWAVLGIATALIVLALCAAWIIQSRRDRRLY